MAAVAPALLYALFVWWFATGLVLLLVLRGRRAASLCGAAILFPISLYLLWRSGAQTSVLGAYHAFTAAILLWGTQEFAFLTGALTGPRPLPCPPGAGGSARLGYALGAILYHEFGLILSGLAVLVVTWRAPNQIGALTFLVLWVMRLSAKLNLFLGVPVLNDEFLPLPLAFIRSYFRRGPANAFFPVAVVISVLALSWLVTAAAAPEATTATEVGDVLVASLLTLAIVEHGFMLVPLPISRLWAWSTGKAAPLKRRAAVEDAHDEGTGKLDRAAVTSP